ncbi:MAG TPA: type II toxin-antitoxin system HipA family toxin [Spirochaetales bacterium]|nr:type II toxin-antitoxin system HipA family toxin [Spirochaetales bacterium]
MGRPSTRRELGIWLNGIRVGTWAIASKGIHEFTYTDSWLAHPQARPISLSLPLAGPGYSYRGEVVASFFDNLLPDSSEIRRRIRSRYGASSLSPFDLLAEVGRDCVGAIQLVPGGEEPCHGGHIEGRPVDDHEIAAILKGLTSVSESGLLADEEFRISLAGAQEKTALLRHEDRWLVPHGSTPSTHILKLPLGRVGGIGFDMSGSVENEWLCSKVATALGLKAARCEIARFEDVSALVVERFDRRSSDDGKRILRLPQEDFCQITGTPPTGKYESDGGPGIEAIMRILLGSQESAADREAFMTTQVLFWLLAAPDGHAKNYSVFIERGGRFRLTPLYDIMSAYTILGHGDKLMPPEKLRLAMAFSGKNRHYEWAKIEPRHLRATARRCGMESSIDTMLNRLAADIPRIVAELSATLPRGFPGSIADPILDGLERQCQFLRDRA